MSLVFLPSQSKTIFVGREDQIEGFKKILVENNKTWILHIPGEGGIGKTRLLEQYEKIAREIYGDELATTGLVDFYDTRNQTNIGLLDEISTRLGFDPLGDFNKENRAFQDLINSEGADQSAMQDRFEQVYEKFLFEYKELLAVKKCVLLLFDTCEEMKGVEEWALDIFLEDLDRLEREDVQAGDSSTPQNRKTVIVFAGRKELPLSKYKEMVWDCRLSFLSTQDIKDYFDAEPDLASSITEEELHLIHERTAGRPLYIALVYDWLVNGIGALDELLGFSESFAAELVGWVRRLEPVKKMAILYMAFAWRRMEISLLSDLLSLSLDETKEIINELIKFSFIKYRPIEDGRFVINLHDEMRTLVNEYVWNKEISVEQEKPYAATLAWYAKNLNNPNLFNGKDNPKNDRERALLAEDLYYRLRMNLADGLRHYGDRFKSAVHYLDLAYCNMLNQEVTEVRRQLSQEERDKHDFRTALTAFRTENYQKAGGIWHAFVSRPDVDPLQRATTLMLLVEMDSYTGNPKEAMQHAKEAERAYLTLLKKAATARERSPLKRQLGELYNNWGFACRVRDDHKQALEYYQKALQATGDDPQTKKHKARVLNNMGYVYHLMGDTERARTYVGRALQIRQDLNIPYELGLGYNTFGEIMEDSGRLRTAMDLYAKAYQAFDDIHSNRGKAMAQINLGKMKRFMREYDASLSELFKAEQVLKRLRDRDNLLKVLNEIGSTYRQKGDWQNALKYLNDALELSIKLGKRIQQADTLDDIAVTYYKMALRATGKEQKDHLKKADSYAVKSQKLAQSEAVDFFIAKADLALGDISYLKGEYNIAFKHYFDATSRMAKAWASRNKASGFYQRRYEESLDRMQERLHEFERKEGIKKTLTYVKKLLAKIDRLPAKEKTAFAKARRTLKATLETTRLAK